MVYADKESAYLDRCEKLEPHVLNPCVRVKHYDVLVNINDAVRVSRRALERMGYAMGPWLDGLRKDGVRKR